MGGLLDPNRTTMQDVRGISNMFMLVAQSVSATVEVFIHKDFGVRYFGMQGVVALLFVPMFGALLFPEYDQRPLWVFLGLFLFGCPLARVRARQLQRLGRAPGSQYNGWPRSLKPSASARAERYVKQVKEPLGLAVTGMIVYAAFNPPLGAYLVLSAICLVVTNRMYQMWVDRKAHDMRDAMLDQYAITERLNELQHGE